MEFNYIQNWTELCQHVLAHYPNESGGYVTQENIFVPVPNIASDPKNTYEANIRIDLVKPKCIVHSHTYNPTVQLTDDPRIPSKADLQGQIDTAVEWAIVVSEGESVTQPIFWGDPKHRPPLMDREFIHSAQDCLAFMRDWHYLESGLELPACARDFDWFETGYNLFEDLYEEWGFTDASHLPTQRGDVLFYRIRSKVVNHIGVLVAPNMVADHLFGRFPKTEPTALWDKYCVRRIRHKSYLDKAK